MPYSISSTWHQVSHAHNWVNDSCPPPPFSLQDCTWPFPHSKRLQRSCCLQRRKKSGGISDFKWRCVKWGKLKTFVEKQHHLIRLWQCEWQVCLRTTQRHISMKSSKGSKSSHWTGSLLNLHGKKKISLRQTDRSDPLLSLLYQLRRFLKVSAG